MGELDVEKLKAYLKQKQEANKSWFIADAVASVDIKEQLDDIEAKKRDAADSGGPSSQPSKKPRTDY